MLIYWLCIRVVYFWGNLNRILSTVDLEGQYTPRNQDDNSTNVRRHRRCGYFCSTADQHQILSIVWNFIASLIDSAVLGDPAFAQMGFKERKWLRLSAPTSQTMGPACGRRWRRLIKVKQLGLSVCSCYITNTLPPLSFSHWLVWLKNFHQLNTRSPSDISQYVFLNFCRVGWKKRFENLLNSASDLCQTFFI